MSEKKTAAAGKKHGTGIEWTWLPGFKGETWNPTVGCSKVSEGCRNCYAIKGAHRLGGNPNPKIQAAYQGLTIVRGKADPSGQVGGQECPPHQMTKPEWTGKVRCLPERLEQPLRWKKPRSIFVNSMSDLFHPDVPDNFLLEVFTVMAQPIEMNVSLRMKPPHDRHTFMILTKRPERMRDFMSRLSWKFGTPMGGPWKMESTGTRMLNPIATLRGGGLKDPAPNIWLGVSAETQKEADERIGLLCQTPAAVRFLSVEPMLGPVDLDGFLGEIFFGLDGPHLPQEHRPLPPLDWVICGGESGKDARPMHPDWPRTLRDQCQATGVPFFFKQQGEWASAGSQPTDTPGKFTVVYAEEHGVPHFVRDHYPRQFDAFGGCVMEAVGKKAAGRMLDGVEHSEFPRVVSQGKDGGQECPPHQMTKAGVTG